MARLRIIADKLANRLLRRLAVSQDATYESRIQSQIEQYREVQNIHDLPDIFHYWSNKVLRPRLNDVFGVESIADFYAVPFAEAARQAGGSARFLSIGAGDCSVEISVAKRLLALGLREFRLTCLELSPHLLQRAQKAVDDDGLRDHVFMEQADLNQWPAGERRWTGIMANHSLHHLVELERIFDGVANGIEPGGVFVTSDMIGRNGHMRWPETLDVVDRIWAFLPNRQKYNRQLQRLESKFINFDCSGEGFEGIRAQDILPLLLERFRFKAFYAYGGILEVFIDRAFGHNLDPKSESDRAFVDFVSYLNDTLIDAGVIKPTAVFAVMTCDAVAQTRQWRTWSPGFCVRPAGVAATGK